jgi:hypothetical protein
MVGMEGDPKNPNAWWGVKFPSFWRALRYPERITRAHKVRVGMAMTVTVAILAALYYYLKNYSM